tara:strand:+ start:7323 stop:7730 length:408 start_codon:yes stop_codon:yes gene_type:complete
MEFFRPYSMIVPLASTTASGITLVDSSGGALACNYISIEASGAGDAFYRAELELFDASNGTGTALLALGTTLSATTCQFGASNKGICEFVLSDNDRSSVVTIQLSEADATNFMITYGYIQWPGNTIRALERPIGR